LRSPRRLARPKTKATKGGVTILARGLHLAFFRFAAGSFSSHREVFNAPVPSDLIPPQCPPFFPNPTAFLIPGRGVSTIPIWYLHIHSRTRGNVIAAPGAYKPPCPGISRHFCFSLSLSLSCLFPCFLGYAFTHSRLACPVHLSLIRYQTVLLFSRVIVPPPLLSVVAPPSGFQHTPRQSIIALKNLRTHSQCRRT
jgi:hypothetical protein